MELLFKFGLKWVLDEFLKNSRNLRQMLRWTNLKVTKTDCQDSGVSSVPPQLPTVSQSEWGLLYIIRGIPMQLGMGWNGKEEEPLLCTRCFYPCQRVVVYSAAHSTLLSFPLLLLVCSETRLKFMNELILMCCALYLLPRSINWRQMCCCNVLTRNRY